MKRYCLALDLKDDPEKIKEYEKWHRNVWPEVKKSIWDAGINSMEIYRTGNRLFMIMETDDSYSFEVKAAMDASNSRVQEWESKMDEFQLRLPWGKPEEKWVLMTRIFEL